jgi:hypothetical protein
MPIKEHLIELTDECLIACKQCHSIADITVVDHSPVRLICPYCHETLGSWATTTMAIADLTALVAPDSH